MSFLFGHLYDSPCKFTHDQAMFGKKGGDAGIVPESRPRTPDNNHAEPSAGKDANREQENDSSSSNLSLQDPANAKTSHVRSRNNTELANNHEAAPVVPNPDHTTKKRRRSDDPAEIEHAVSSIQAERNAVNLSASPSTGLQVPSAAPHANLPSLSSYEYSEAWKQQAFEAAQGTCSSNWNDITLVSVSGHQQREEEL